MLEARRVVGHDVGVSWEMKGDVAIALATLVGASVVAEVSAGAFTGDGAFGGARDCRSVVATVHQSGVPDVVGRGHEGHLG